MFRQTTRSNKEILSSLLTCLCSADASFLTTSCVAGEIFQQVEELNKITRILIPVTISVLLATGVVGNVLVILVSIRSKKFQNSSVHTWLVLSIAMADLCYLIISAPYYVSLNFA